jgi:hypothetical protein
MPELGLRVDPGGNRIAVPDVVRICRVMGPGRIEALASGAGSIATCDVLDPEQGASRRATCLIRSREHRDLRRA